MSETLYDNETEKDFSFKKIRRNVVTFPFWKGSLLRVMHVKHKQERNEHGAMRVLQPQQQNNNKIKSTFTTNIQRKGKKSNESKKSPGFEDVEAVVDKG